MHRAFVLLLLMLSLPALGGAGPITHEPCDDVTASVSLFKQVGPPQGPGDVLENLGFDGLGYVWVSNSSKGRVEKYDASGVFKGSFVAAGPGALTQRSDGIIYANIGDSLPPALLARLGADGAAAVVKFDPSIPIEDPTFYVTVVASGFKMANGGIFDADGNYYLSNDVDFGLTKINPDQTVDHEWTAHADVWGTNGLVVKDNTLYAAVTFDGRSPIERIPLAAPHAHSTFVETTFGVASLEPQLYTAPQTTEPLVGLKGLDDMTLGPDGNLWVVANGMGELLRVDLNTKEVCLVVSGLQNPSSIRFSKSFGSYDDTADLFITEFSGAIRRVHLT